MPAHTTLPLREEVSRVVSKNLTRLTKRSWEVLYNEHCLRSSGARTLLEELKALLDPTVKVETQLRLVQDSVYTGWKVTGSGGGVSAYSSSYKNVTRTVEYWVFGKYEQGAGKYTLPNGEERFAPDATTREELKTLLVKQRLYLLQAAKEDLQGNWARSIEAIEMPYPLPVPEQDIADFKSRQKQVRKALAVHIAEIDRITALAEAFYLSVSKEGVATEDAQQKGNEALDLLDEAIANLPEHDKEPLVKEATSLRELLNEGLWPGHILRGSQESVALLKKAQDVVRIATSSRSPRKRGTHEEAEDQFEEVRLLRNFLAGRISVSALERIDRLLDKADSIINDNPRGPITACEEALEIAKAQYRTFIQKVLSDLVVRLGHDRCPWCQDRINTGHYCRSLGNGGTRKPNPKKFDVRISSIDDLEVVVTIAKHDGYSWTVYNWLNEDLPWREYARLNEVQTRVVWTP